MATQDQRFTERQVIQIGIHRLGMPVPIHNADLTRPFIYDRRWGVFFAPRGGHTGGMALLYAFHKGFENPLDMDLANDVFNWPFNGADKWLEEIPGTCFYSSVSYDGALVVHKRSSLSAMERRLFRDFKIVEMSGGANKLGC